MISSPRKKPNVPTATDLDFELTQEIDPAFADLMHATSETTLTQIDFDDLEVALGLAPRPAGRRA
jgi:hypothetical protein